MSRRSLRFTVTPGRIAYATSGLIDADDDPRVAIIEEAIAALSVDISIEAGGIKMPLACWIDPEHFESDWHEALGGEAFEGYLKFLLEGTDPA